jgi:hypothetical protein
MTADGEDRSNGEHIEKGPVSREKLYEQVWSEPMLKVAVRYGVSASYLARICKLMNVPKPERGYWARQAAGWNPRIPPLPKAGPGDERFWARNRWDFRAEPVPPVPPEKRRRRRRPMDSLPALHGLIDGAQAHFEGGRKSEEIGYLNPDKWALVDLLVTQGSLERAFEVANRLFLELEARHCPVVLAPQCEGLHRATVEARDPPSRRLNETERIWGPSRCTVVYLGTVAIGLTIVEIAEGIEVRWVKDKYVPVKDLPAPKSRWETGATWTTQRYFPTGKLALQAYSPYRGTKWVKVWRETAGRALGDQIRAIVNALEEAAEPIAREAEEAAKQAELERQRWKRQQEQWRLEEEARRAAEALKESKHELRNIVDKWAEANRIEQFFQDAQRRAGEMASEDRERLLSRLDAARRIIGTIDALQRFSEWKTPEER